MIAQSVMSPNSVFAVLFAHPSAFGTSRTLKVII